MLKSSMCQKSQEANHSLSLSIQQMLLIVFNINKGFKNEYQLMRIISFFFCRFTLLLALSSSGPGRPALIIIIIIFVDEEE